MNVEELKEKLKDLNDRISDIEYRYSISVLRAIPKIPIAYLYDFLINEQLRTYLILDGYNK
jgi:hypothetical protein